jgi:hypothetical protein
MYVTNETGVPIRYVVVGGGVAEGTLLPGQAKEIGPNGGSDARAEVVSFSTDDGSKLPEALRITLGQ